MTVMLYGPAGTVTRDLARAIADMFGLVQVLDGPASLFQVTGSEPALLVREATEAPARNLAQAYGMRTVVHVDDAHRLLQHAYGTPPAAGLDVVDGTAILKGNADLSPQEQRALEAAQVNLRG